MWKLRHRDKLICPRLHSSYVPEPLFEPRQSRFTRQFQVLARWHPGPATWEATAPACTEQTLLTHTGECLLCGLCVWGTWQNCSPFQGQPTPGRDSLTLPSSLQFGLPDQNVSFLCVPPAFGACYSSPHITAIRVSLPGKAVLYRG